METMVVVRSHPIYCARRKEHIGWTRETIDWTRTGDIATAFARLDQYRQGEDSTHGDTCYHIQYD
jgi:hypothetical protein